MMKKFLHGGSWAPWGCALSACGLLLLGCGGDGASAGSPPTSGALSSSSSSSGSSSGGASSSSSSSSSSGGTSAPLGVVGNTLCLNADGPTGDATYSRIESVLGSGAIEAPSDAVFTPNRPHVEEVADDGVVGPHFAILAVEPTDVNQDMVSITAGGDRSRTEIKIAPSSGNMSDAFKAHDGDTYVYAWRFRIAPTMKFSPSFTHIHQIKAYGGLYSDPPLITFTPLSSGRMEIRHVGDLTTSSSVVTVLGNLSLAGVPGQWMDVREEITYSNSIGRYKLSIRDQNGIEQLNIDRGGLPMWRTGSDHMRPKWGIYRKHHTALNQYFDDYIYFANFAITRGAAPDSNCR